MDPNSIPSRGVAKDSDPDNSDQRFIASSEEDFTEKLLLFFRNSLKDSFQCRERDQTEVIRRSWNHFQSHLDDERYADIYLEVIFSVFEIFPFTSNELICEVLENFVSRKIDKYHDIRIELTRDLPLIDAPFSYIPYYVCPWKEVAYSAETFYSTTVILDLSCITRLLRYGARFRINPLQTRYCLTSILACLTEKLLPLVYPDVEWDSFRVNFVYRTYHHQRRLYLMLLFLYVVVQSKKSAFLLKWRSHVRSLNLLFEATPEPFFTASEINRFLSSISNGEVRESVYEDLIKKFAELFPRVKEPSSPRSLKHLSRCTVRECLARSKALPHGVWYLDIPTVLKHYLLLQRRSDEFYPRYVHSLCSNKRSASGDGPSKRPRKLNKV